MRFKPVLPSKIFDLIELIQKTKDDKNVKQEEKGFNLEGYFKKTRIIDPLFILIFYGLYDSEELPPHIIEKLDFGNVKSHDFGSVDISQYKNIFNHLLFCLWVEQNGFPEASKNSLEYREKLYKFLDSILIEDFFSEVTIPFYLSKVMDSQFFNLL